MAQMISDELLQKEVHLEHHGTRGMKWGKWNAETRRRYMRLPRKAGSLMKKGVNDAASATKKGAEKVAAAAKGTAAARSAKRAAKKAERAEINEQRKELGMTKAKYDKLREQTLKSHDPTVVAKGMHTLTDKELDAKISRLQKEETISKLSTSKETRKHNERKARSEAIQANPAYKIGKQILDKQINKWLDNKVGDGASDAASKAAKKVKEVAEEASTATSNSSRSKKTSDRSPQTYSTSGDGDRVRKVVRDTSKEWTYAEMSKSAAERGKRLLGDGTIKATVVEQTTVNNSSSSAADRGKRLLGDGSVRDQVIDVTPIDASSERGRRKS